MQEDKQRHLRRCNKKSSIRSGHLSSNQSALLHHNNNNHFPDTYFLYHNNLPYIQRRLIQNTTNSSTISSPRNTMTTTTTTASNNNNNTTELPKVPLSSNVSFIQAKRAKQQISEISTTNFTALPIVFSPRFAIAPAHFSHCGGFYSTTTTPTAVKAAATTTTAAAAGAGGGVRTTTLISQPTAMAFNQTYTTICTAEIHRKCIQWLATNDVEHELNPTLNYYYGQDNHSHSHNGNDDNDERSTSPSVI